MNKIKSSIIFAVIATIFLAAIVIDSYFNNSRLFFGVYRILQLNTQTISGYNISHDNNLILIRREKNWTYTVADNPTDSDRGLTVKFRDNNDYALKAGLKRECETTDNCKIIETENYIYFKFKKSIDKFRYDYHVLCLLKNKNLTLNGIGKIEDMRVFDKVISQVCP